MRKCVIIGCAFLVILSGVSGGCRKAAPELYTFGIFQITDAPTLNEARKGFIQALTDKGLRDGVNVRLMVRNAMGALGEPRRIAQEFVNQKTDMIIALSTQCLQAAMMAGPRRPIIFASVANPQLLGVGRSSEDHSRNITGVASTAPIKQALDLICEALPTASGIAAFWRKHKLV